MADYIDRDELASVIDDIEVKHTSKIPAMSFAFVQAIIEQQPSVDAVEQKHGHWDYDDECECYVCSNCEMSALNNWRNKSTNSNYCPHCGAKMDEVTE